jgi:hypothetical protein
MAANPMIIHYYRTTPTPHSLLPTLTERLALAHKSSLAISSLRTEISFNIQLTRELSDVERHRLEWLLSETFEKDTDVFIQRHLHRFRHSTSHRSSRMFDPISIHLCFLSHRGRCLYCTIA